MDAVCTKNMTREQWLYQRKRGIGGPDEGAICGLNPYSSPMDIYLDKTSGSSDNSYSNISKGIPPRPDGSEATEAFLRTHYNTVKSDKTIQLSGFDEELQRHKELVELISKLEVEKRIIEEQVKMLMDDAETAYTENYIIRWTLFEQDRLDTKRLKNENPELYDEYKKKITSRRFVIKEA